jgi:hypothetical protein
LRSAAALIAANCFDFPVSNNALVSLHLKDWIMDQLYKVYR